MQEALKEVHMPHQIIDTVLGEQKGKGVLWLRLITLITQTERFNKHIEIHEECSNDSNSAKLFSRVFAIQLLCFYYDIP